MIVSSYPLSGDAKQVRLARICLASAGKMSGFWIQAGATTSREEGKREYGDSGGPYGKRKFGPKISLENNIFEIEIYVSLKVHLN